MNHIDSDGLPLRTSGVDSCSCGRLFILNFCSEKLRLLQGGLINVNKYGDEKRGNAKRKRGNMWNVVPRMKVH